MNPEPALPEVRVPSLVVILPALENARLLQGVAPVQAVAVSIAVVVANLITGIMYVALALKL